MRHPAGRPGRQITVLSNVGKADTPDMPEADEPGDKARRISALLPPHVPASARTQWSALPAPSRMARQFRCADESKLGGDVFPHQTAPDTTAGTQRHMVWPGWPAPCCWTRYRSATLGLTRTRGSQRMTGREGKRGRVRRQLGLLAHYCTAMWCRY